MPIKTEIDKVIDKITQKDSISKRAEKIIAQYANEGVDYRGSDLDASKTLSEDALKYREDFYAGKDTEDPELSQMYKNLGLKDVKLIEDIKIGRDGELIYKDADETGIDKPDAEFKKTADELSAKVQINPEEMSESSIYKLLNQYYIANKIAIEASKIHGAANELYAESDFKQDGSKNFKRYDTVYSNLLLEGDRGVGKTSVIDAWARENGVNITQVKAQGLRPEDMQIPVIDEKGDTHEKTVKSIRTQVFEGLERPNSVLFLDEYNTAPDDVRAIFYSLVNEHRVPDSESPTGQHVFKNMIFAIAAINPATKAYGDAVHELNDAEKDRFDKYEVRFELASLLSYLKGKFVDYFKAAYTLLSHSEQIKEKGTTLAAVKNELIVSYKITQLLNFFIGKAKTEVGKKQLEKVFLKDKLGRDGRPLIGNDGQLEKELIFTPRGLERKLQTSLGDKDTLIKLMRGDSNTSRDAVTALERLLADYHDADVKTNQAILHKIVTGIRPENERTTLIKDEVVDKPEEESSDDEEEIDAPEETKEEETPTPTEILRRENRGSVADRLRRKIH